MTTPQRRVTATDVAKLAGCSQAAVSLWLNGKHEGRLTPEWQQRIAAAVAELGYVPNRTAQKLSSGTGKAVSFIFPGFSYNFFGPVLEGVSAALGGGWDLSFYDSRANGHPRKESIDTLFSSAVGADTTGVILASPSALELEAVASVGAALVVVDAPEAPPSASRVAFDAEPSIQQMASELAALGHHRVGYVSLAADSLTLIDRRKSVVQALRSHGIRTVGPDLRVKGVGLETTAELFIDKWPRWRHERITAIICSDERHAYGVLIGARRLGIRIPEDLSLAAFNDSDPAQLLSPSLSSIQFSAVELGAAAGRALKARVSGQKETIMVPTQYTGRESTGPALLPD
ncbi:LacI family DNA-binding transcriptional regulator [Paenarthrobacter sp. GOM3]|uniref:LacI family DNA-binding transcriptional regulator n=1 Tax=Paenarthrobacter sp. GOM3 TaxID=2782567 RepID=UPI001BA76193|nr:LacI family DNA-binding transcriptional regulator [Paenarthrobacter sp. GOM3]WOH20568.1 LacI family DNA-binding transcriptional regulator [Paenarthrobacter sp. GOM3]